MDEVRRELVDAAAHLLDGNDRDFFRRVWATPADTYINRLKAISCAGLQQVLDAGCGMGQWLPALARLNVHVEGIEYSEKRVAAARTIVDGLGLTNVTLRQGSVETTPFSNGHFDAIFSYSVILCTDYRKTLREFYRILKPGGILYFNTNGLGWYLHNLLQGHNSTENFSPQQMAIEAFENSLSYYSTGKHTQGACIITPSATVVKDLQEIGFQKIRHGAEGTVITDLSVDVKPFFKGEYAGHEGVIEYLCEK